MLFTVMLIFLPALLTNCGHGECLSYIGTEGISDISGKVIFKATTVGRAPASDALRQTESNPKTLPRVFTPPPAKNQNEQPTIRLDLEPPPEIPFLPPSPSSLEFLFGLPPQPAPPPIKKPSSRLMRVFHKP